MRNWPGSSPRTGRVIEMAHTEFTIALLDGEITRTTPKKWVAEALADTLAEIDLDAQITARVVPDERD